jgi:hypothetical protein
MHTSGLQRRFEFTRGARLWQFLRALALTLAGIALVYFRFSLTSNDTLHTILLYLGGFLAVSGGIALLVLVVLALTDKKQVVEVDDSGFTYVKGGKTRQTRTVKWSEVTAYELDTDAPILDLGSWMDAPPGSRSSDDLFGCLVTLVLGLYILVLQVFIGGLAWKVTFRLKSKRSLSFSAPGGQMSKLVDQVLPYYLPGKRKDPNSDKKQKKPNSDIASD